MYYPYAMKFALTYYEEGEVSPAEYPEASGGGAEVESRLAKTAQALRRPIPQLQKKADASEGFMGVLERKLRASSMTKEARDLTQKEVSGLPPWAIWRVCG